ncbi:hypothetical protein AB7M74_011378 [Bradyrhizobium japonicum]
MIDRDHDLSIVRQAKVLKLARSTVYYEPRPVSAEDLALMRRLDELHLDYPFAGARMLRSLLRREGVYAGRRHIATLMKRMGIEAVYRRPNTSKPAPGHKIYPYLLRGLKIERPDHAWAMDITYIPMRRGFVYLAAVVDVFSRRVLAHRVCHNGGGLLRRSGPGGVGEARQARDFQHGSGQPVHQPRVHRCAAGREDRHQHGRQGRLARQRVCRAALAHGQIRRSLSPRLRQRVRGASVNCQVSGLLQSGMAA